MLNFNNFTNYSTQEHLSCTDGDYNLFLIKGNLAGQEIKIGTIGLFGDLQRRLISKNVIDFSAEINSIISKNEVYINLLLNGKFFREDEEYIFYPGKYPSASTIALSWGKYPKLIFKEKFVSKLVNV